MTLTTSADLQYPTINDSVEDQILFHRQFLSPNSVPLIIKKWLDHEHKGSIVAVSVPFKIGDKSHSYKCFGSHARAIARIYGHATMSNEDGITVCTFSAVKGWHLMNCLRRAGIELILID